MPGPQDENHDTWVVTEEGAVIDFVGTPPPDAAQILAEIGEQLQSAKSHTDHSVAEVIEMVEAADWRGRDLVSELNARYLAGGKDTESTDQVRIWEAVSLYLTRLASAYVGVVRLFQTYSRGWAEVGDKLPQVIARAIRTTSLRLKWQRMRYRPVETDIWQTLSQLWSYVEDKGLTRARVLVYEDRSTLQREFVKPLMFAMSAVDSLPPVELDVVDKMIAHFAGRFELQQYPAKSCYFLIDIDQWTPAARYRPGDVVRLGSRFFGPGDTVTELETISAQLAAGAISTNEFNLYEFADVETVVETLAHLERHWSVRRPERREARRRSLAQLAIVSGYNEIVERIASNDVGVRAEDDEVESWGVENESEGGYGAVLPNERGEKLHVGELIAVRPSGSRVWAVGVIRRLAAQDVERRYVGIELLARGVQTVPLSNVKTGERAHTGLLLPSHIGDSVGQGEINLLLPTEGFSPDVSLEMEVYDNHYFLEPHMVLETGDDFEVARYRILDQAS
jgi:hypothetical protein